jgi:hypothetical protein
MYSSVQGMRTDAEAQSSLPRSDRAAARNDTPIARLFAHILKALHESRRCQAARVIHQYRRELGATGPFLQATEAAEENFRPLITARAEHTD